MTVARQVMDAGSIAAPVTLASLTLTVLAADTIPDHISPRGIVTVLSGDTIAVSPIAAPDTVIVSCASSLAGILGKSKEAVAVKMPDLSRNTIQLAPSDCSVTDK